MSQVDLATFKQDTANEFAQLQSVLQKTMNDFVDATSRSVSGEETNGAGGLGPQLGGSTAGILLASHSSPGAALSGQPITGGPGGASTLGQVGGIAVGPGTGYGYGIALGDAGTHSALLGPAGGITAGQRGGAVTVAPGVALEPSAPSTDRWPYSPRARGRGSVKVALRTVPEPPAPSTDRWTNPPWPAEWGTATAAPWAVIESPAPTMDSQAGSPWANGWPGSPWALGRESATAAFSVVPEPSVPPIDSQAGSSWALGRGSTTVGLWAVPESSPRHRSHSAQ